MEHDACCCRCTNSYAGGAHLVSTVRCRLAFLQAGSGQDCLHSATRELPNPAAGRGAHFRFASFSTARSMSMSEMLASCGGMPLLQMKVQRP